MKSFIFAAILLSISGAFALERETEEVVLESDDVTITYYVKYDLPEISEDSCLYDLEVPPVENHWVVASTPYEQTAFLKIMNGSGAIEEGKINVRRGVATKLDDNENGMYETLATVSFPIWVVPYLLYDLYDDYKVEKEISGKLHRSRMDLKLPVCGR